MDYQKLIDTMSPEIYRSLLQALEIGRWPDGRTLSAEQREHTMHAVIAWGEKHLPQEERIGYIDKGSKAGEQCDDPEEKPLNWKN